MPKLNNKPTEVEESSQIKTGSPTKPKQNTRTTAAKVAVEGEAASSGVKTLEAVYILSGFPRWVIRFKGGGEVPQTLSGSYTRKSVADAAIESYLATRKK